MQIENNKQSKKLRNNIRKEVLKTITFYSENKLADCKYNTDDLREMVSAMEQWARRADGMNGLLKLGYLLRTEVELMAEDWDTLDQDNLGVEATILDQAIDMADDLSTMCQSACRELGIDPDKAYLLADTMYPADSTRGNRYNRKKPVMEKSKECIDTFKAEQRDRNREEANTDTFNIPQVVETTDKDQGVLNTIQEQLDNRLNGTGLFTADRPTFYNGHVELLRRPDGSYLAHTQEHGGTVTTQYTVVGVLYAQRPILFNSDPEGFCYMMSRMDCAASVVESTLFHFGYSNPAVRAHNNNQSL